MPNNKKPRCSSQKEQIIIICTRHWGAIALARATPPKGDQGDPCQSVWTRSSSAHRLPARKVRSLGFLWPSFQGGDGRGWLPSSVITNHQCSSVSQVLTIMEYRLYFCNKVVKTEDFTKI